MPRRVWLLLAGNLVNKSGTFLLVFLVLYLTHLGYSPVVAGIAVAVNRVGALQGTMLGGWMADRWGRRPTIAASMLSSAFLMALMPLAHGLAETLVGVGLIGVVAQACTPALGALLIDIAPPAQRVMAFAGNRLAINVGMTVGPMVAGLLATRSFTWVFLIDAATSAVFGLIAIFGLGGSMRTVERLRIPSGSGYVAIARDVPFVAMLVSAFLVTMVYIQSTATLPLQVTASGLPVAAYGVLIGLNGLLVICLEVPLTVFTRLLSPQRALALGALLQGGGFALCIWAHSFLTIAATIAIWTMGEMVSSPVTEAYAGGSAEPHLRARYQAAWGLAQGFGNTVGSLLGSLLFVGGESLLWLTCGLLGLSSCVAALVSARLVRTGSHSSSGGRRDQLEVND